MWGDRGPPAWILASSFRILYHMPHMIETRELKGTDLAITIQEEVRAEAEAWRAKGLQPKLTAVVASSDPSMLSYVRSKARAAEKLGIAFEALEVAGGQAELEAKLAELSHDAAVHGIMLELPLRDELDFIAALRAIDPKKDVDGLTPANLGLVMRGREEEAICGATALACVILAESLGPLEGKRVAVVGKGKTVGRPLIPLLLNRQATVAIAHAHTADLARAIRDAEIVFIGTGQPGLIMAGQVVEGQVLIDAGLTVADGGIKGDVDRAAIEGIAAVVTPVPEGVGPVTTALAFKNLMKAMRLQNL